MITVATYIKSLFYSRSYDTMTWNQRIVQIRYEIKHKISSYGRVMKCMEHWYNQDKIRRLLSWASLKRYLMVSKSMKTFMLRNLKQLFHKIEWEFQWKIYLLFKKELSSSFWNKYQIFHLLNYYSAFLIFEVGK